MPSVLVRASSAVIKCLDKKQLGEERIYYIFHIINPSLKKARSGTQGRSLEAAPDARARRNAADWLAHYSIAYICICIV